MKMDEQEDLAKDMLEQVRPLLGRGWELKLGEAVPLPAPERPRLLGQGEIRLEDEELGRDL